MACAQPQAFCSAASSAAPSDSEESWQGLSNVLAQAFGVEIRRVPGKGRGLFTAEDFSAGDTVLQELPLAWALDPRYDTRLCNHCCTPLDKPAPELPSSQATDPEAWGDAFRARFCSDTCAQAGREGLGLELAYVAGGALREAALKEGTRQALVVANMVARALSTNFELYWQQVRHLGAAHPNAWSAPERAGLRVQHDALRAAYMKVLDGMPQEDGHALDAAALFDNVLSLDWYTVLRGVLKINAFQIPTAALAHGPPEVATLAHVKPVLDAGVIGSIVHDAGGDGALAAAGVTAARAAAPGSGAGVSDTFGDDRGIGTALFLATSFINHECEPNCSIAFTQGPVATVTATRDLPAGTELSIAYFGKDMPWEQRKVHLGQNYGFVCTGCSECEGKPLPGGAASIAGEAQE